jgi:hypothetical protein
VVARALKTALVYSVNEIYSYPQFEYSPIDILVRFLSFRLLLRSTRILKQIVIITPLFTGQLPRALKIRRLYDE